MGICFLIRKNRPHQSQPLNLNVTPRIGWRIVMLLNRVDSKNDSKEQPLRGLTPFIPGGVSPDDNGENIPRRWIPF